MQQQKRASNSPYIRAGYCAGNPVYQNLGEASRGVGAAFGFGVHTGGGSPGICGSSGPPTTATSASSARRARSCRQSLHREASSILLLQVFCSTFFPPWFLRTTTQHIPHDNARINSLVQEIRQGLGQENALLNFSRVEGQGAGK
jgi:hypothetical protein